MKSSSADKSIHPPIPQPLESRLAHIYSLSSHYQFPDNEITTSKYTALSFIPVSLLEQFRRIANVYFLVVSFLMIIGTYLPKLFESPLQAYSTLAPLCIVLAIAMGKEGLEDYRRHQSDHQVNNSTVLMVAADGTETPIAWKDVRVGMVIKVLNKDEVPADVVALQTSETGGSLYVATTSIDGETNLKLRKAVSTTVQACPGGKGIHRIHGDVEYDLPNDRIHNFTGRIRVGLPGDDIESIPHVALGPNNIILRGCQLRNTKYMYGLVVYTGRETKVMKKSGSARSKMSQIEKTMNLCIKLVFVAQALLCTLTVIAEVIFYEQTKDNFPYLMSELVDLWIPRWLGNWFSFLLLFNNFIPISLYVTVEIVNFTQAAIISRDIEMYDEETDTPARARTSNLNQDLGQLEYIFSDKTGTLTRNIMEFKQCSVGGRVFGRFVTEADANEAKRLKDLHPEMFDEEDPSNHSGATPLAGSVGFEAPELLAALGSSSGFGDEFNESAALTFKEPGILPAGTVDPGQLTQLEAFFTLMAVAHTVVPEREDGAPIESIPVYQAESPDEAALTLAARQAGFAFMHRTDTSVIIHRICSRDAARRAFSHASESIQKQDLPFTLQRIDNPDGTVSVPLRFDVLGVHEFNSTRKRMSVVVRSPTGRAFIMVKGADNVIFERSKLEKSRASLEHNLTAFAETGLRTLVLAQRELSPAELAQWKADFTRASVAMVAREDELAAVAEKYERDLVVLGATAIEDRLQEDVPNTIRDFRRAGVKTWVLTGDKVETAINIGFSSKLLDHSMHLLQLTSDDNAMMDALLRALALKFSANGRIKDEINLYKLDGDKKKKQKNAPSQATGQEIGSAEEQKFNRTAREMALSARGAHTLALVVTGHALTHILNPAHADGGWRAHAFLTVASNCKSVIACRVSPKQKADIVHLVRAHVVPTPLTLAIGDGANDVGMIQRAEVGVGISGKEGLQAANSADFSISQFRFLRRLLLVHGRWDYRRMAKLVLYSFYKNVVITFSLFFFNALTGFSGTSFYESLMFSSYNFVLGLPIIGVGIFDRDIKAVTAEAHPSVYAVSREGKDLNARKMVFWIIRAIVHATILFWVPYGAYSVAGSEVNWDSTGKAEGMDLLGVTTFSIVVLGMTLRCALITLSFTRISAFFFAVSILLWYILFIAYSFLDFEPIIQGVFAEMLSRPAYYLTVILAVGVMHVMELTLEAIRLEFFPSVEDIHRELDRGYYGYTLFSKNREPDARSSASPQGVIGGRRRRQAPVLWGDEELLDEREHVKDDILHAKETEIVQLESRRSSFSQPCPPSTTYVSGAGHVNGSFGGLSGAFGGNGPVGVGRSNSISSTISNSSFRSNKSSGNEVFAVNNPQFGHINAYSGSSNSTASSIHKSVPKPKNYSGSAFAAGIRVQLPQADSQNGGAGNDSVVGNDGSRGINMGPIVDARISR